MDYDEVEVRYINRKRYLYRCEDCGYQWSIDTEEEGALEEDFTSSEELFNEFEASECPMCGNNNIVEV